MKLSKDHSDNLLKWSGFVSNESEFHLDKNKTSLELIESKTQLRVMAAGIISFRTNEKETLLK